MNLRVRVRDADWEDEFYTVYIIVHSIESFLHFDSGVRMPI